MAEVLPLHWIKEEFIDEVYELISAQWPNMIKCARMAFLKRSNDKLPLSMIVIKDGRVIGHARIKHLESMPRSAYVESVVVDSAMRGKGYGKLIMEKSEEHVKLMGFEEMYLFTYDRIGFYKAIGYQICPGFPMHGKPCDPWLPDTSLIGNHSEYQKSVENIQTFRKSHLNVTTGSSFAVSVGHINNGHNLDTNEIDKQIKLHDTKLDVESLPMKNILPQSNSPNVPPPPPLTLSRLNLPPPPPPSPAPQKVKQGLPPTKIDLLANQILRHCNLEESEDYMPKISMRKEL